MPFSFKYDNKPSSEALGSFDKTYEAKAVDCGTEHSIIYRCRQTGLRVTCCLIEYSDFGVVDWTLYFANEGETDTPIVSDILVLETEFM